MNVEIKHDKIIDKEENINIEKEIDKLNKFDMNKNMNKEMNKDEIKRESIDINDNDS